MSRGGAGEQGKGRGERKGGREGGRKGGEEGHGGEREVGKWVEDFRGVVGQRRRGKEGGRQWAAAGMGVEHCSLGTRTVMLRGEESIQPAQQSGRPRPRPKQTLQT